MFTIATQRSKVAKVQLVIDGKQICAVPAHIRTKVGSDKAKLYRNWLQDSLKDNHPLLNFLARIFEMADEKGSLALISQSKATPYQAEALKSFFVDNEETLRMMIPYLKQGMSMQKKDYADLTEEERKTMASGAKTLGDLPPEDRDQIAALLEKAMAEDHQAAGNPAP